MVFSSIPAYLDPANWQQQQQPNYQTGNSTGTSTAHHFHPPPPPPPPPPQPHGVGSGTGSIRPGSMADRARMANLPMPEVALKCPRCESSNTKFCYFNNYSLSQPRHFCKTCRRYWTRGGALRNVPVGGGCRRNKRNSKGSSSNNSKSSPVSSSSGGGGGGGATTSHVMLPSNSSSGPADIIGLGPQFPPLRFMGSNLHNLTDHYGSTGEIGLNYGGINFPGSMAASTGDINFFLGSSSGGGGGASYLSAGGMEHQWRLPQTHQFPFLPAGGMDLSHGLFPVEGGGVGGVVHEPAASYGGGVRPKTTSEMAHDQGSSVKTELTQDMNMSRQFLGIPGNEQYWSTGTTAAWTDLSGFSSSSTSHPL